MIVSYAWDEEEPKLLVVHTKPLTPSEHSKENLLVCLWVSPEKGIILHEVPWSQKLILYSYALTVSSVGRMLKRTTH